MVTHDSKSDLSLAAGVFLLNRFYCQYMEIWNLWKIPSPDKLKKVQILYIVLHLKNKRHEGKVRIRDTNLWVSSMFMNMLMIRLRQTQQSFCCPFKGKNYCKGPFTKDFDIYDFTLAPYRKENTRSLAIFFFNWLLQMNCNYFCFEYLMG